MCRKRSQTVLVYSSFPAALNRSAHGVHQHKRFLGDDGEQSLPRKLLQSNVVSIVPKNVAQKETPSSSASSSPILSPICLFVLAFACVIVATMLLIVQYTSSGRKLSSRRFVDSFTATLRSGLCCPVTSYADPAAGATGGGLNNTVNLPNSFHLAHTRPQSPIPILPTSEMMLRLAPPSCSQSKLQVCSTHAHDVSMLCQYSKNWLHKTLLQHTSCTLRQDYTALLT